MLKMGLGTLLMDNSGAEETRPAGLRPCSPDAATVSIGPEAHGFMLEMR